MAIKNCKVCKSMSFLFLHHFLKLKLQVKIKKTDAKRNALSVNPSREKTTEFKFYKFLYILNSRKQIYGN